MFQDQINEYSSLCEYIKGGQSYIFFVLIHIKLLCFDFTSTLLYSTLRLGLGKPRFSFARFLSSLWRQVTEGNWKDGGERHLLSVPVSVTTEWFTRREQLTSAATAGSSSQLFHIMGPALCSPSGKQHQPVAHPPPRVL